ncbi:MAG: hypothetical protein GF418_02665 [Chitinivibrionales bacterium]|nr:hypothetical protein [Chitinivibrionales bacterium]MBD3394504.1 hypothetical protein [Chitinivibrionales bacterium]
MMERLRKADGITLVEALAALAVSGVLAMVIYTFIMFSSKTMRKITAMQLMQQESSVISEVFIRDVRNGSWVSVGDEKGPPPQDTAEVDRIAIRRASDSAAIASFAIDGAFFIRNWHDVNDTRVLSENLWIGGDESNHFDVFQNGDHVEFYLNLHRTVGDDTVYLSQTVGDVRCKN